MKSALASVGRFIRGDIAWLEVDSHRKTLYGFAVAEVPVLVAAGLLSSGVAQDILVTLGALSGTGAAALAHKHTWSAS